MPLRIILNLAAVILLNSCFTATLFTLPDRGSEEANKRQDYIATAALPVAVVAEVATSPIQAGAIGVHHLTKSGTPAEEAKEPNPGWLFPRRRATEGRTPKKGGMIP